MACTGACRGWLVVAVVALIANAPSAGWADSGQSTSPAPPASLGARVVADLGYFYSAEQLARTSVAFTAGALLANSSADASLQRSYGDEIRSSATADMAETLEPLGRNKWVIAASVLGSAFRLAEADSAIGRWGERSARALVIGAPALAVTQHLTGGSRPGERADASRWRPLADTNGVSGHAFFGAVPFLTVAGMADEQAWVRYGAYVLSAGAAWSRVDRGKHFVSQSALGWFLAWQSVGAVNATQDGRRAGWRVRPMGMPGGIGVSVQRAW